MEIQKSPNRPMNAPCIPLANPTADSLVAPRAEPGRQQPPRDPRVEATGASRPRGVFGQVPMVQHLTDPDKSGNCDTSFFQDNFNVR